MPMLYRVALSLLGHTLAHDRLNMSNEMLCHLAIMYVNKMDKNRNVTRSRSHMTTHEMIPLCSSLQGVGTCIPFCVCFWVLLENIVTPHLRLAACCSIANFCWGSLVGWGWGRGPKIFLLKIWLLPLMVWFFLACHVQVGCTLGGGGCLEAQKILLGQNY